MIVNLEIKFGQCAINYTVTPCTDYSNMRFTNDFANAIAEVVKMSGVNPAIVIEQIKEISETENPNNNE